MSSLDLVPQTGPAVEADSPRIGVVVGDRYRIDSIIARGGMGSVFRAWDLALERIVAVKSMHTELTGDGALVNRFLDEGRVAATLKSPHVVSVLDVGVLPSGAPYLVMEHLQGTDLHGMIERHGALAPERACRLIIDACAALSEAHDAGIVHRDIKPENLFLSTDHRGNLVLKVIDFGIAKRHQPTSRRRALTQAGQSMGSPSYMAPEQMLDPGNVDARADIWGLGATLYHAVVGRPPFDGGTVPEVCAKVLSAAPEAPSALRDDLDPALERAILQCLDKDPQRRYPSADALAQALMLFAATLPAGQISRAMVGSPDPITARNATDDETPTLEDIDVEVLPSAPPTSVTQCSPSVSSIPGLRQRRLWVIPAVGVPVLAALGLLGAERAGAFDVRSLTDGWMTPAPLHIGAAPSVESSHRPADATPSIYAVEPRGVVGRLVRSRSTEGRRMLAAEPELGEEEPAAKIRQSHPTPRVPPSSSNPQTYGEYLQQEGLRPMDEVLVLEGLDRESGIHNSLGNSGGAANERTNPAGREGVRREGPIDALEDEPAPIPFPLGSDSGKPLR